MFTIIVAMALSTISRRRTGALSRLDVRLRGLGATHNHAQALDSHDLRAMRALAHGDAILSFPSDLICSVRNARLRSPGAAAFYDEILRADRGVEASQSTRLAAQLAVVALHLLQQLSYPVRGNHRQQALKKMWRAYVESLPRDAAATLPLLWGRSRLHRLGGSALRPRIALQRVRHAAQWGILRRILGYPSFADGARGEAFFARFGFDDWLRALAIVQSRWFSFDAVGVELGGDAAVVPLLDMANHADEKRATMRWGVERARLVVRAAAPLDAGAPLTDSYGSAMDFWHALPHLLIWLDEADDVEEPPDVEEGAFSFWSVGFLSHLGAAHLSTLLYGFAAEHYACVVRVMLPSRSASTDLAQRVTLVARFSGGHGGGAPVLLGASAVFWQLKAEQGSDAAIALLAAACAAKARHYIGKGLLTLVARLELALLELVATSASASAATNASADVGGFAAAFARNALLRVGTLTPSGAVVLAELASGASVVLDASGAVREYGERIR